MGVWHPEAAERPQRQQAHPPGIEIRHLDPNHFYASLDLHVCLYPRRRGFFLERAALLQVTHLGIRPVFGHFFYLGDLPALFRRD